MKVRIWANAGAAWALFYVGLYIAAVHGQRSGVFTVYAFVVLAGAIMLLPTGLIGPTLRRTNLMLVALGLFVLAALWALRSGGFGLLLAPSVVATVRALSKVDRGAAPADEVDRRRR